jgi:hypothetical protein
VHHYLSLFFVIIYQRSKLLKIPSFKHIEGRFHYIHDVINRLKTVHLVYLFSTSMVADPLIKPLRNYFLSILEIWDF